MTHSHRGGPVALFIRHTALPGRRDELAEVWSRHMPSSVQSNGGHTDYHYCFEADDADAIIVFQRYIDAAAAEAFRAEPSYQRYLAESQHLLAGQPTVTMALPYWTKKTDH